MVTQSHSQLADSTILQHTCHCHPAVKVKQNSQRPLASAVLQHEVSSSKQIRSELMATTGMCDEEDAAQAIPWMRWRLRSRVCLILLAAAHVSSWHVRGCTFTTAASAASAAFAQSIVLRLRVCNGRKFSVCINASIPPVRRNLEASSGDASKRRLLRLREQGSQVIGKAIMNKLHKEVRKNLVRAAERAVELPLRRTIVCSSSVPSCHKRCNLHAFGVMIRMH